MWWIAHSGEFWRIAATVFNVLIGGHPLSLATLLQSHLTPPTHMDLAERCTIVCAPSNRDPEHLHIALMHEHEYKNL